jgi:hypothetical protein
LRAAVWKTEALGVFVNLVVVDGFIN